MTQKENVDNYFIVYVHRGIAKHHCTHLRVKAHAISVSIRALLSCVRSLNFGENSMNKILSGRFFLYVFIMSLSLSHRLSGFDVIQYGWLWL